MRSLLKSISGKQKVGFFKYQCASTGTNEQFMNVFDRNVKRKQRNRASLLANYKVYDYLKEEVGWRVADRISDIKRKFGVGLDIGCGRGYVSRHVYSDMVETFYQMEMAQLMLDQAAKSTEVPTFNLLGDEEFLPFKKNSLDLVTSCLSLHWVNNLPSAMKQINDALKNDGCFLGSMFGGETLYELRSSLQLAETEREGGIAAHISPFTSVQDLGNLLNRAGFVLLTLDLDEIVIRYPSMFELMWDLQGMAESNCTLTRRGHLPRQTLVAAAAIYQEMYSDPEQKGVPATFQVLNFIGWKPDPSQKGPAKRGSGQVSFKDLDKLSEITKEMEKTQHKPTTDSVRDLEQQLDDLTLSIKQGTSHDDSTP